MNKGRDFVMLKKLVTLLMVSLLLLNNASFLRKVSAQENEENPIYDVVPLDNENSAPVVKG